MTAAQWIADYGYAAVFVGCLLEGETVLVVAGFAARKAHLELPFVMLVAALAATLGDQLFFFIGGRYGAPLLARFPKLRKKAEKVDELVRRYHGAVIVGIRFMYGMRIAGPIIIGMSDIPKLRRLFFNFAGACAWAVLVAGAGYVFGASLEMIPGGKHLGEGVGVAVLLAVMAGLGWRHWRKARRENGTEGTSDNR